MYSCSLANAQWLISIHFVCAGTEDAMLVDSLAQRVDGTLANYCVALQTVDDQFIEQSEEIVVEFVADSRILAKEQCSLMIEDDDGMLFYDRATI